MLPPFECCIYQLHSTRRFRCGLFFTLLRWRTSFYNLSLNKNRKEQFDDDTQKGIASLKQHLGTNTVYFAYPYGFGNPDTDQILMSHGINNIFTLSAKVNHTGDKQFYIGRFLVTSDDWEQIKSWVQSK